MFGGEKTFSLNSQGTCAGGLLLHRCFQILPGGGSWKGKGEKGILACGISLAAFSL